ncbi:hypothetical protein [Pseudoalteromonas sp. S1688]|uniref:hypothetical protein n=1 Tax=Pseudoalteromonas sp. S1688 TaxID=579511 RepID=UPI00110A570C|nr:hypothetical protein [Pseudoalteromonas sp. S1688]TMP47582.1 hypothetical protein CWB81_17875 [Pseudoalteromonas sp. S1688]
MLVCAFIFISLVLAKKHSKLPVVLFYYFTTLLLITAFVLEGVEAAYQVSTKPSDSHLYHSTFLLDLEEMHTQLFFHYPYFIKLLILPFSSAYFALVGQSAVIVTLLLLILKKSNNFIYGFILLNHALLYTITNFFKDNLFIIIFLSCIFLLGTLKGKFLKALTIFTCILLATKIRPFIGLFTPLAALPYYFSIKNQTLKNVALLLIGSMVSIIIFINWSLISYVLNNWSDDASVGSEGFSILSPLKVILGPTPFHYFYFEKHFVQPFITFQAWILTFFHYFYYAIASVFFTKVLLNIKLFIKEINSNLAAIFSFSLGFGVFIVYMLAYGSADIRQRAIIILFVALPFFICRSSVKIFSSFNRMEVIYSFLFFNFFFLVSVMSI